jgi:hypothetical protein
MSKADSGVSEVSAASVNSAASPGAGRQGEGMAGAAS